MVEILNVIGGITLALIATLLFNFGIVLQKIGLSKTPEMNIQNGISNIIESFKYFFKNKYWLTGTIMGLIGLIPYTISMGLIGILVVQPLMSVGLIIFVLAAITFLKEKIKPLEIMGVIMLGISPFLIVFAGISEIRIDLLDFSLPFIIFFVLIIIACISIYYFSILKKGTLLEAISLIIIGGLLFSLGAISTNILAQAIINAKIFPLFFWEILFGIFWFIFLNSHAHLWAFLGFWNLVIFYVLSIIFIQGAYQKGKTIVIVPIQNSIQLIIPIIVGIFIFEQEFENYYLFLFAIALILISIIFLSKFQAEFQRTKSRIKDSNS